MYRFIIVSGGVLYLSPVYTDKQARDLEAHKEFVNLALNSGLPDDNVILLNNASAELEVCDAEHPETSLADVKCPRRKSSTPIANFGG